MSMLRLGVFVSEEEECFHVSASPVRRKHPYVFEGDHFMVYSTEGSRWLRSLGLSGRAHDVLSLFCERAGHGNVVGVAHSWIAGELGVVPSEVSRQVKTLREAGVLWRLPSDVRGFWRVAPRLMWKGNPRDLPEALALYRKVVSGDGATVRPLRGHLQEVSA